MANRPGCASVAELMIRLIRNSTGNTFMSSPVLTPNALPLDRAAGEAGQPVEAGSSAIYMLYHNSLSVSLLFALTGQKFCQRDQLFKVLRIKLLWSCRREGRWRANIPVLKYLFDLW